MSNKEHREGISQITPRISPEVLRQVNTEYLSDPACFTRSVIRKASEDNPGFLEEVIEDALDKHGREGHDALAQLKGFAVVYGCFDQELQKTQRPTVFIEQNTLSSRNRERELLRDRLNRAPTNTARERVHQVSKEKALKLIRDMKKENPDLASMLSDANYRHQSSQYQSLSTYEIFQRQSKRGLISKPERVIVSAERVTEIPMVSESIALQSIAEVIINKNKFINSTLQKLKNTNQTLTYYIEKATDVFSREDYLLSTALTAFCIIQTYEALSIPIPQVTDSSYKAMYVEAAQAGDIKSMETLIRKDWKVVGDEIDEQNPHLTKAFKTIMAYFYPIPRFRGSRRITALFAGFMEMHRAFQNQIRYDALIRQLEEDV